MLVCTFADASRELRRALMNDKICVKADEAVLVTDCIHAGVVYRLFSPPGGGASGCNC